MSDKETRKTDRVVSEIERSLKKEYSQAQKEAEKKLNDYLGKFKKEDEKKAAQVRKGEITQEEYKQWRLNKITGAEQYKNLTESMARSYTNAGIEASGIIQGRMYDVYADNYNYAASEIKDVVGSAQFEVYDRRTVQRVVAENPELLPKPRVHIPKTMRWNQQRINSSIVQGILQGEAIDKIAGRLRTVSDMDKNASMRNARTMMTAAQNAGRMESYHDAEKMGIEMEKVWLATNDERTRDSHAELNGETVGVDEEFSNGLMYPADPAGDPAEVYNCRCTLIAKVKGVDLEIKQLQRDDKTPENEGIQTLRDVGGNGIINNNEVVYKKFESVDEVQSHSVTKEERRILYGHDHNTGYINSGNAKEINRAIREGEKLSPEFEEIKDTLTNVINKNTMPENVEVVRYVRTDALPNIIGVEVPAPTIQHTAEEYVDIVNKALDGVQKGYIDKENNFLSTSLVEDNNVMTWKGVEMHIKVPEGTNCYITTNEMESECIFGIGSELRLDSVKYDTSQTPYKFVAEYTMIG